MMNGNMTSLEKLCLDVIVQNFERFNFAFSVSKDVNLQRNFQFLQRKFSDELATAVYKVKKLRKQYFELLINEHLNFLAGEWLKNSRHLISTEEIFFRTPNLRRFSFRRCSDEILKNISTFCPKVTEIDVRSSDVTDKGLEYLCETKDGMALCSELKNIFVDCSGVTDRGVENLIRNLPSLEKIDYSNVPMLLHSIHEENLRESENIKFFNLIKLDLFEFKNLANYTDILKSCLIVCSTLESLECYISNEEELNIFANSHLKDLYIEFLETDPKINIDKFLELNGCNLTCLEITDCTMSVSLLAVHCPVLTAFKAVNVKFTDDDDGDNLHVIFSSLTKCIFIAPSNPKAMSLFFSSSPKLKYVTLANTALSLEMKNQIIMWCKTPCAKKIFFRFSELKMKYLREIILNSPSLKIMDLMDNDFDFADAMDLRGNNFYVADAMDLRGNNFYVADAIKVLQCLAKCLPNKPTIYGGGELPENIEDSDNEENYLNWEDSEDSDEC